MFQHRAEIERIAGNARILLLNGWKNVGKTVGKLGHLGLRLFKCILLRLPACDVRVRGPGPSQEH
jgi:hypothetical protein